jgi:hypothetical protein
LDSDKNGKQDASEIPIAGVKVSLYKNGLKIAETLTAANGEYYFNNKNQSGVTWLGTVIDTAVLPLANYDIVFGEAQFANGNLTIGANTYFLTTANEASSDLTDNDATINTIAGGSFPSILNILTPNTGNNYSFDAGFQCPDISNPSGTQALCIGSNGSNITVNTNLNAANSIKFIKFSSDQTVLNATPTAAELNNIYAGTSIATVTPTGASNPYTATYTFVNSDFPNTGTTAIDYFVYAILANDISGMCRPIQEIKVTINPLPGFSLATTNVTCNGQNNGTITITTSNGATPFDYSIDDGLTFPSTTGAFIGLLPASYKPAIKDANGCVKKCN